jgi:hypothetical protein
MDDACLCKVKIHYSDFEPADGHGNSAQPN